MFLGWYKYLYILSQMSNTSKSIQKFVPTLYKPAVSMYKLNNSTQVSICMYFLSLKIVIKPVNIQRQQTRSVTFLGERWEGTRKITMEFCFMFTIIAGISKGWKKFQMPWMEGLFFTLKTQIPWRCSIYRLICIRITT